jgi:TolB-like protein
VAVLWVVRGRARSSAGAVSPPAVVVSDKSIAVLPFDSLSDDKENSYFGAAVQDEILSNLARITDLKVISRTSASLYKSANPRNLREIGQQLVSPSCSHARLPEPSLILCLVRFKMAATL